jgi:2-dehydro-3-deoxyphosphogluconate aldolase/(4S)-4-hydroxy-2-oxoglutarate aldolase
MVTDSEFLRALKAQRLLAILRGNRQVIVSTGLTLIECGISCLEVSLTSESALVAIEELSSKAGADVLIGAGTVLTADDARRAASAGAQFTVTPGLGAGAESSRAAGLPVLGGALTPTEVSAAAMTCAAVKLFPASIGGPAYLGALRAPFPDVPFVPVGGVDAELMGAYLAAGAVAVGVGSPLIGDAASGGSLAELASRAKLFRSAALVRTTRKTEHPSTPSG